MYIPRLRKIGHAIKEIKSIDPNTELNEYLLFQLVRKKELKTIKYGNAWLINLDDLFRFFKTKETRK